MLDLFDLTGKTAIVTGGAGILGRGFCRVLADHGCNVALVDLAQNVADNAAADIAQDERKGRIFPLACDVANPNSVAAMIAAVVSRFGGIHVLHNNAATKTDNLEAFFEPFESYDLQTWNEVFSVNVAGVFVVAQAAGQQMIAQGVGGSIINTSSIYGILAPDQRIYEGSHYLGRKINTPAVYSASKAAVIGLARYLATYWAQHGIRVNVLTPGGIESGQNETFVQKYSARVPLGRLGTPDELHGALLFLASDASSYVTGQNIIVDGGLACW
jgi:NAD(P)-dependent dehydrogenase (short-subunit alcohol dehydrogenase family)